VQVILSDDDESTSKTLDESAKGDPKIVEVDEDGNAYKRKYKEIKKRNKSKKKRCGILCSQLVL
jgi:hypothetical protein